MQDFFHDKILKRGKSEIEILRRELLPKKYSVGIDVGGTNVKIAVVDLKGNIVYSNSVPTRAEMGYEYTIKNIKETIYASLKETKLTIDSVQGIGIGLPGQINSDEGMVRLLPNIPGWKMFLLVQSLRMSLKLKQS